MSNMTVDITPDKSLIKKLGLVGYRTEQAVAELIDNSIDARLEGTETIEVTLDFKLGQIKVSDDGRGMDSEGLGKALTVAKETKKGGLGQFGLGLKSACSSLGKAFAIRTAAPGTDSEFTAVYDEDLWLGDASKGWTNFEIEKTRKDDDWHGTRITISKVKVPLYPNQILNFRRRFGIRYGPHIERGQVRILVNSRTCRPSPPELADGKRHPVSIETTGGRMTGWVGLLARRSIKGDYGIHLYRGGRLISAFDKFGIRRHPTAARVVGELSLDHVPVNFHKTGFLTESPEYREAASMFIADPTVKMIMRRASSPKVGMSDVESVLVPGRGSRLPPLDTRMSAENAKSLLRKAGKFTIRKQILGNDSLGDCSLLREADKFTSQKDDTAIDFEFDDSDAISFEAAGGGVRVGIGRNSPAFRLFKNPLFLVGQIRIEAELAAGDPSFIHIIERKNRMLDEFVRDRLPLRAGGNGSSRGAVPLPAYSLQGELVDLHDYLKETFEHDFQFTGLSTLAPFLHHSHSRIIYAVHTIPGAGQSLLEDILDHTDAFAVMLNPHRQEIAAVLEESERSRFIVIREYREGLSPVWAGPEKAWLDLYFEVTRDRIPLYHDELILVLDELLDAGLARPARVRSLARRRQILKEIEGYLPEE